MATVTFNHYSYSLTEALGAEVVSRMTSVHHNDGMEVTVEGVSQAECDAALATHLLRSAKDRKKRAVVHWRNEQERAGFEWNGNRWDSDPTSAQRIMAVALAGIDPPTGYWTSAENVDVPVDKDGIQSMYSTMIAAAASIHHRHRQMKTEIEALSTVAAVEAYEIRR